MYIFTIIKFLHLTSDPLFRAAYRDAMRPHYLCRTSRVRSPAVANDEKGGEVRGHPHLSKYRGTKRGKRPLVPRWRPLYLIFEVVSGGTLPLTCWSFGWWESSESSDILAPEGESRRPSTTKTARRDTGGLRTFRLPASLPKSSDILVL